MDFGFISVYIDDFTPCLKDNATGELIDTEVIRIRRSSFLEKYNKKNAITIFKISIIPLALFKVKMQKTKNANVRMR